MTTADRVLEAAVLLRKAVHDQRTPDPDLANLYDLGSALTAVMYAAEGMAGLLPDQLAALGSRYVLRDDDGADPHNRVRDAVDHLADLRESLAAAGRHAAAYQAAIGHVGIAVDPTGGSHA